jgi:hypothetical protein
MCGYISLGESLPFDCSTSAKQDHNTPIKILPPPKQACRIRTLKVACYGFYFIILAMKIARGFWENCSNLEQLFLSRPFFP